MCCDVKCEFIYDTTVYISNVLGTIMLVVVTAAVAVVVVVVVVVVVAGAVHPRVIAVGSTRSEVDKA